MDNILFLFLLLRKNQFVPFLKVHCTCKNVFSQPVQVCLQILGTLEILLYNNGNSDYKHKSRMVLQKLQLLIAPLNQLIEY